MTIIGIVCGLIGFLGGYFLNVRETDAYIHVIQVNGTVIQGEFQSIGLSELEELNDLVFQAHGSSHKILQILVTNSNEVELIIGGFDDHKPHPHQISEQTYLAKKKDGRWEIKAKGLASTIN